MALSLHKGFSCSLLLLFLLANTCQFISGSDVQGDCSKDGSCEDKHGKEKYISKGIDFALLNKSHVSF